MTKQLLSIGFLILLSSCGQQPGKTNTSGNDTAAKALAATDTVTADKVPMGSVKSDDYKSVIDAVPANLGSFIPQGYAVLDTASGDLNLDAYPDMIMVLKKNGEDSTSDVVDHPEKRPLLILTGQPDKTFKLAAKSDNAVYCFDCGGIMGDPFQQVVIKNGYFSVEHYGGSSWRWARTITFKYSAADNNWYLHKDGHESFHASDPEKTTTKIYTTKDFGKLPFEKFDIYKDTE